jgi:predicted nucleic acid-binding protein
LPGQKRIFLDSNVLVAIGFRPSGEYSRILAFHGLVYVTSEQILREVTENLIDLGVEPSPLLQRFRLRMEITDQVTKRPAGLPLHDDGDRQALSEAIAASCDEFITCNSRDFKVLYGRVVSGVYIRHSAEFLRLYAASEYASE